MGFTITSIILAFIILIAIVLAIIAHFRNSEVLIYISIPLGAIPGVILFLIVGMTYTFNATTYSKKGLLKEKEQLEFYLDQKDKYFFDYLSKAKTHNEVVQVGNNMWYRWSVEDRSEYMVDIEYYQSTLIGDNE